MKRRGFINLGVALSVGSVLGRIFSGEKQALQLPNDINKNYIITHGNFRKDAVCGIN